MSRFEQNTFPQDIEDTILLLADARSLVRARSVCRRWKDLIEDRGFIKRHARLQILKAQPLVFEQFRETKRVPDFAAGRLSITRETTACFYNPFVDDSPGRADHVTVHEFHSEIPLEWTPLASAAGLVFMASGAGNPLFGVYNPLKLGSFVLLPSPGDNLLGFALAATMHVSAEDFSYTIHMLLNRRLYTFSSVSSTWSALDFLASPGWERWVEASCNMLLDDVNSTIWMIGADLATGSLGLMSYNLVSQELRAVYEWSEGDLSIAGHHFERLRRSRALVTNEKKELVVLGQRVRVFRDGSLQEISASDSPPVPEQFGAAAPTGVWHGSLHLWKDYGSCRDFVVDLKSSGWECSAKTHNPSWLSKEHVIPRGPTRSKPLQNFSRQVLSIIPTLI